MDGGANQSEIGKRMRTKSGMQMRAKEMDQNAKQMKQNERNRKTQKGGKSSIEREK